jgi:hypothetical protein
MGKIDYDISIVSRGLDTAEHRLLKTSGMVQPDYSVGFRRSMFTKDQLEKLKIFIGKALNTFTSHLNASWQMYFPFLMCEVKCGSAALDIFNRTLNWQHNVLLMIDETSFRFTRAIIRH